MATMVALSSFAGAAARSPMAPRRRAGLVVRAQTDVSPQLSLAAGHGSNQGDDGRDLLPNPNPNSNPNPNPGGAPKPKASTSVWDALAFSGPLPERINGRLAMVGFVSALLVEAARGDGLLSQAGSGAGLGWFVTSAVLLSVASLVPLLQGQSVESRSDGVWSADAELWNGRFAMLGLVALAVTEFITGTPFVNV